MRAADLTGSLGCQTWTVLDSNQRRPVPTDLQSVPFVHLGNRPGLTGLLPVRDRDNFVQIYPDRKRIT